ncbi:restriction endonuclease subunit S [Pectobacterium polaris]|uniref:restriction endonuclease subunit S n=1 Tax=Pectobacterium polaris TaxID=2042057 RepID=UPI0023B0155B|nr:restriction endonuclease subunit S [Pectobacterium polaris]MDE8742910.1 restriction endonuclease subunit S [Pectobacterium polaris]
MSNSVSYLKYRDVADFRNGLNFSKDSYGKGCLLIGVADFKDYFSPKWASLGEINPFDVVKEDDYLKKGDIIFVRSNGNKALVGRSLYIDRDVKSLFSGFCIRARPKTDDFYPLFLAYFSKTERFGSSINSVAGTNINNLNQYILGNVEIPFYSKDTQKSIVDVLSSIDKKIEINNRINAELESMAKMLYDYWFVQFYFPDANGKPYKTSGGKMVYNAVLKREIPAGWKIGNASELFNFNPLTSLKTGSLASYIDMDSLPVKGFMTKKIQKKEFAGGTKFIKNDVAVARITPCLENGKTGLMSKLKEGEVGFGSTEFIILRGKEISLSGFGACLARSDSFRQFAISNMTGTSGRKRIESKILETYTLPIPSKNLLMKFENIVQPFFDIMTSKSIENDELTALRDWLLPLLMNGQVTVK